MWMSEIEIEQIPGDIMEKIGESILQKCELNYLQSESRTRLRYRVEENFIYSTRLSPKDSDFITHCMHSTNKPLIQTV